MAKYIKSYSTYTLETKHQNIKDGVIYSKDITTIDSATGTNNGQTPVYKSGNFVITTNNDYTDYKKVSDKDWHRNDEGEIWTLNILNNYEKDEKSSDDRKIVIKKDYYDLRDFAYYGSCSELMRTSIDDILKHYPGELFIPYETVYVNKSSNTEIQYTKEAAIEAYGINGYNTIETGILGYYTSHDDEASGITEDDIESVELGMPYKKPFKLPNSNNELVIIDNPFEINMHDTYVPKGADPLRYFADGGISNYAGYINNSEDGEWMIDKDHEYSLSITDLTYDGVVTLSDVIFDVSGKTCNVYGIDCDTDGFTLDLFSHKNTDTESVESGCTKPGDYIGWFNINFIKNEYGFIIKSGNADYGLCKDSAGTLVEMCCKAKYNLPINGGTPEKPLEILSFVEDAYIEQTLKVYMFMGDDYKIKYLVENNPDNFNVRIRPKEEVIDSYFKKLTNFQKILLNRNSDPLYTADFELIGENNNGMYTYTRSFTFPTTYGGFNLGSNNQNFTEYINSLSEVGEFYDSLFTDNLWRSMTHEAIKNFDWTYTRQYAEGEEIPFIEGGNKIKKIIRVYGREFDEIKSYIDAIDDSNTVTYDNINNLPDYFFTDKLEDYGWDVKLVYPLILSEFVNGHTSIPVDISSIFPDKYDESGSTPISTAQAEKMNYFYDAQYGSENRNKITIQRVFNQDFSSLDVKPYLCDLVDTNAESDNNSSDCPSGTSKVYCSDNQYSSSDVNNEFMKRLILNSNDLWAHKGTIDGIEMLLSIFGLRSKKRVYSDGRYFKDKTTDCSNLSLTESGNKYYNRYLNDMYDLYDYDIKEYTLFTTNIEDKWDADKNMYEHDWVNSTKLTINSDDYEPYQGLPVSYSACTNNSGEKIRQLYPHFNSYETYDGNPYYQMNGGWMEKTPFMFDTKNNIVTNNSNTNDKLFTETIKNIKCVGTLQELLSNYSLAEKNGDICQVLDLSGRYAIIDGYVYDIYTEKIDNNSYDFIYATIQNNSLSVGNAFFTDYVIISNPYDGTNNKQRINLTDDYFNDREIKIYIINNDGKYSIDIYSKESSINTFTVFENGKYMDGDNYTNYFIINNIDYYNELSVLGWRQLRADEYEYYKMDTIVDDMDGNNPHTGHMKYDNGYEYLTYFNKLFKHSIDNDTFDYRRYTEDDLSKLNGLNEYGFNYLISGDCDIDYDYFLREDTKCHYFGSMESLSSRDNVSCFKHIIYNNEQNDYKITNVVRKTVIDDNSSNPAISYLKYGNEIPESAITTVTDQIVNTKRMDIEFYIHNVNMYSKEWLEEVKYIDSVILPYLYQMIPSNVICRIKYITKNGTEDWKSDVIICDNGCDSISNGGQ